MNRSLAMIRVGGVRHLRLCGAGTLLLSLVHCGGKELPPDEGGGGQQTYDACEESARLVKASIADFEAEMTVPSWYAGNDGTPGVMIDPATPERSELEAPKCPSDAAAGYGFHVVASGFQSWGYNFGFNTLNNIPGAGGPTYFDRSADTPEDPSDDWVGISLWVRKGPLPSSSSIFAAVADKYTDPSAGSLFGADQLAGLLEPAQCPAVSAGAPCFCNFDAVNVAGSPDVDPELSQCDKFGIGIGIAEEWRFFKIPFERMSQRAYGRPSALLEPAAEIIGLEFGLQGQSWDFWIDEISFYKDPAAE